MKIVEQSKQRMVVRHEPWWLVGAMILMGLAPIYAALFKAETFDSLAQQALVVCIGVATLIGAWWIAPVVTLDFDRRSGRVIFRETRLFLPKVRSFDLAGVARAMVEAHWDDGNRLTRLVLRTADGVIAVENGYSSAERDEIAQQINDWLAGKTVYAPPTPAVRR